MKKIILVAVLAVSSTAFAAENAREIVNIDRTGFGSGMPALSFGNAGVENAPQVNHDTTIFHAPQYMPFYPTAAVIWPRVLEVNCKREADTSLTCEDYRWAPSMGRAEYLFITPKVAEAPKAVAPVAPVVVVKEVIREVPRKKISE